MNKTYRLVYRFFIVLVLLTSLFSRHAFSSSINLFLKPAPAKVQRDVKRTLATKGNKALSTKNNGFKKLLPSLSGHIALYGGYVDYSDKQGTILFPRLQKASKLFLIITSKIEVEAIEGNTIAHKTFAPDVAAKIYLFEQLDEAPDNGKKPAANKDDKKAPPKEEPITYWRVSEVKKPDDNKIENLSIVLLTNPKNIVVATGNFMTKKTANLTLPDVHVVGNQGQAKIALDFLDMKRFFEPIKQKEKVTKEKKVLQSIIDNL